MTTAVVAIFVLGVLVLFHELGHFGVAKWVGIRVHEFAIGMGPKVFSRQTQETLYSLRALPIGGFVRMEGEDAESSAEDSFSQKSVPKRISVIVTGPLMNFLLGFLCFFVLFFSIGIPTTIVDEVIDDSPAAEAGIEKEDQIIRIDDQRISEWNQLVGLVAQTEKETIRVTVDRDGEELTKTVKPMMDEETGRMLIGIAPTTERSVFASVRNSYDQSRFIMVEILSFLQELIRGQADSAEVAGPVGIISLVGEASRTGWMSVVGLAGLISINLGLINLLPIPALDGSRIVFLLIEGIRGRPVDPEKEALVHMIGIAFLMFLMIVITYRDILTFL